MTNRKEGRKEDEDVLCFSRGWKSVPRVARTVVLEETHVQVQKKRNETKHKRNGRDRTKD